jgi:hypothetical protein
MREKLFEKYNNLIQLILNFIVLTRQLEGPVSEQHVSKYRRTTIVLQKQNSKLNFITQ